MRIRLLAVGTRVPAWVAAGFRDYARRLPPEWGVALHEIPIAKRQSRTPEQCMAEESVRLLAALARDDLAIALHEHGAPWSTQDLATRLTAWQHARCDVAFLIGGPDGLAPACLARTEERWSLSRLTLPHALVRVILAEQLYRASTILRGHPYHRG
jgi:23S rRNA (pseudouridine1915-N3)-methyltransferase